MELGKEIGEGGERGRKVKVEEEKREGRGEWMRRREGREEWMR